MVGDVYQLKTYYYDVVARQVGVNCVYGMVTAETGVGADAAAIALAWDNDIQAAAKACLSSGAAYRGVTAQQMTNPLPVFAASIVNAGNGGVAGSMLPPQISMLISIRTALAKPRWRGRIYPPFVPASLADANGAMTAAAQVLLQTLANKYQIITVAGAGADTSTISLAHRAWSNAPVKPKVYAYALTTSANADADFATQRRRGAFGATNIDPI